MNNQPIEVATPTEESVSAYEAPAIESVLSPESLEREVHYAGQIPVSQLKST